MQTMTLPALSVASSVPGRMRLKLPPVDFSGRETALRDAVHSVSGVTDMRWTNLTNSLVVYYDHRQASSVDILDHCQSAIAPLAAPNGSTAAVPLRVSAVIVAQPTRLTNGGEDSSHAPGRASMPENSSGSLSLWTKLAGTFLIVVGAILLIIPFVPGLPLLLMGLTLLQLA